MTGPDLGTGWPDGTVKVRLRRRFDVRKVPLPDVLPNMVKLRKEAAGLCFWCRQPYKKKTKDHLIPRALGGGQHCDNLVMACSGCNAHRGCIVAFHMRYTEIKQKVADGMDDITRRWVKRWNVKVLPKALALRNYWVKLEMQHLGWSPTAGIEIAEILLPTPVPELPSWPKPPGHNNFSCAGDIR